MDKAKNNICGEEGTRFTVRSVMEDITYCILSSLDGKFVSVAFIMRFALSWKLSSAFLLLDISTYFFSFALKKRILLDPL